DARAQRRKIPRKPFFGAARRLGRHSHRPLPEGLRLPLPTSPFARVSYTPLLVDGARLTSINGGTMHFRRATDRRRQGMQNAFPRGQTPAEPVETDAMGASAQGRGTTDGLQSLSPVAPPIRRNS